MRRGNKTRFGVDLFVYFAAALFATCMARGAEPTANAVAAWNAEVAKVDAQLKPTLDTTALPVERLTITDKARSGKIVVAHPAGRAMMAVESGLIHHWTGFVFLPNTNAPQVLAVLQDYSSYADIYSPAVTKSQLIGQSGRSYRYRLEFEAGGFGIKQGLRGDFRSTYISLGNHAGYSITEATRLVELNHPGTPAECEAPASEARGYVQRMFTVVRYREAYGGVLVQIETLTLSRDMPASLRWMIKPFVEHVSREIMTATLEKFRTRVEAASQLPSLSRGGLP